MNKLLKWQILDYIPPTQISQIAYLDMLPKFSPMAITNLALYSSVFVLNIPNSQNIKYFGCVKHTQRAQRIFTPVCIFSLVHTDQVKPY